ncbi:MULTISPECIES: homoserine O-succinyltransferase [unclassified Enterococcus]|uniref:homoserine O-succinyltransferase n=1 Tax=unclassified Enterococcus TaxID=2608891 RepID=UPI0015555D94|nr:MULTISPECIES: homoserine O-succinyltransferase [unclassified Enterococcus]MBS7576171.1 homoserine O-succinyltransferase [Enterococcus sp. MMGLQ5-2]MBS7583404.1 homoserine O-succinyltransferase [Enterococcus sp. MMGLQ5-1]NPD11264.1 homoserine O-succinyltransferase [Enterococcus sp. MMGLQ5-1]NPD36007.1 homoserine O-succinyltransferase [Enterococcus sp. MMGLQ5-2]
MPINVPAGLPAIQELRKENIFVISGLRAQHQDIRPLNILILNLMPRKLVAETQLLRLLSNSPLQINIDLLYMETHETKNTAKAHLDSFYYGFDEIKDKSYDGLIVTGAPVEKLDFESVDYWKELTQVFEWRRTHVYSTLYICWGAQAGLYYHYGIDKHLRRDKLSGIYSQKIEPIATNIELFRGFEEQYFSPHSRYTEVVESEVREKSNLETWVKDEKAGLSVIGSKDLREIYAFGHLEYDKDTLAYEYWRDQAANLKPDIPENYFIDDQPEKGASFKWSMAASLFFNNWLNYAVYQNTPFDLNQLNQWNAYL